MDNVLVIGSGFLGGNIVNEFRNNEIKVIGTNYNKNSSDEIHFDITNMDSIVSCVKKYSPQVIINCAANVNVDDLENNEKLAFSINAYGAENIAKVCKNNGRLIKKIVFGILHRIPRGSTGSGVRNCCLDPTFHALGARMT